MDTQGMIYEEERERIRDFVHEFVSEDYVHHRSFSYLHAPLAMDLLKRDPEVVEMANYFTNSLMAYIHSHEIGHHILGHTRGAITKSFGRGSSQQKAAVDVRSYEDEFAADEYAYRLYHTIIHTADENIYYAFFKYRYAYAPILLFGIFELLDEWKLKAGFYIDYTTHPSPHARREALRAKFNLDEDYSLCNDLLFRWSG